MLKNGLLILLFIISQTAHAQSVTQEPTTPLQPLRVIIALHEPPFVQQAGVDNHFGFDISMMLYICNKLKRKCQFKTVPFKDIVSEVVNGDHDVGVGGITITPNRSKLVNFSTPYLPSFFQFMVHRDFNKTYSLSTIQNSSIGYVEGTVFEDILTGLDAKGRKVGYIDDNKLVRDLHRKRIQIAIFDKPAVDYWLVKSKNKFKALGKASEYGFGYGIAVKREKPELLLEINKILSDYLKSAAYQDNIQHYIEADLSIID